MFTEQDLINKGNCNCIACDLCPFFEGRDGCKAKQWCIKNGINSLTAENASRRYIEHLKSLKELQNMTRKSFKLLPQTEVLIHKTVGFLNYFGCDFTKEKLSERSFSEVVDTILSNGGTINIGVKND